MEISIQQHSPQVISIETLSELTGVHPEFVVELEHAELIQSIGIDARGRPSFDDTVVCEVRRIVHLHTREKMSFRMIRYILRLTRRLERVEAELRTYRDRS